MNRLAAEHSPYLKHASHQKINWYPWSEAAFEAARREDKPVFLSSGAAWCHWCHVMAKETFENESVADLLNRSFVCIKLDRDERPDIDRRYQQAVAAMGGGSGWPLSVFLTSGKEPFFGGTYYPPEERQGSPGFKDILTAVSNFYRTRRDELSGLTKQLLSALQPGEVAEEQPSEAMLDGAERNMLSLLDREHGGFGTLPKFPMTGAIEFLLRRSSGNPAAREAAAHTLLGMARGGFHDQLGGGFHRYSVDEAWIVPHFEKMTDDNAGLLKNYVDGFLLLKDDRLRTAAEGIIRFAATELADPAGGFYASQDADVTADDEGGYFTWTERELREALDAEEYQVLSAHLLHPRGRMHHDPSKRVLAVLSEPQEIAANLGKDPEAVMRALVRAKAKLLSSRKKRTAPLVDQTLYTSLNGRMAAAFFRAFMAFGSAQVLDQALKSLDRVLREAFADGRLFHSPGVKAMLDDYIDLIDGLIAGYEATGRERFLVRAEQLMEDCRSRLLDKDHGGFFDTEDQILGIALKRIEDVPHPSANAAAIPVLLKLAFLTGNDEYRREAERSLRLFAGPAREMSVHAGTYFCALHAFYHSSTLTIESRPESTLARETRTRAVASYSTVQYGPDNGRIIPCYRGACGRPVSNVSDLVFSK